MSLTAQIVASTLYQLCRTDPFGPLSRPGLDRALTPLQGVAWAAFWNFIAAFAFGTAVAKTVGSGLLDVRQDDSYVILRGSLETLFGILLPGMWVCRDT